MAALAPVAALAESLRRPDVARQGAVLLRVAPLSVAARTPLTAALAAQQPLLYVLHSPDAALRAAEDLRQWLAPERVLLFAAHDTLSYEYAAPSALLLGQRLGVLQRLAAEAHPDGPPVVVAPLRALLQPTLTPDELRQALITLRPGDWQAQDSLLRRWIGQGYRTVPLVEQPGDVARRGGIADIWPPGDEQPLRIEWFGDEIDSLRRFDAATQRSAAPLSEVTIGPPLELPGWQAPQAAERAAALDTSRLRQEIQAEWETLVEHLQSGDLSESGAFVAPFFRGAGEPLPTLLAHLPPGAPVLLSEALLLAQMADELHDHADEQRAGLISTGELPPDMPRPYLRWPEMLAQTAPLTLVDLSNNEGATPSDSAPLAPRRVETSPLYNPFAERPDEPLFMPAELFGGQLRRLVDDIAERLRDGEHVMLVTTQAARIEEMVGDALGEAFPHVPGRLLAVHGTLEAGWRLPALRLVLYTDSEIFGWRRRRSLAERQRRKARSASERAAFLRGLKPGDYVVHIEHGIAQYEGLLRRTVDNVEREYLSLRYARGDRLYVPVDQVDRVARYVGAGDSTPQLTRLGTQEWERAKRKARAAVRDLADELLAIYARRQANEGYAFAPDNEWQRELEAAFPYVETDDQLRSLHDIKHDMESAQPMDRLMCGDVGFGKTEVALRAAFKAVQDGKQVAVLVPTTVLAQQHYTTFSQRMAPFPVTLDMLSRFRTAREQSAMLQRLAQGGLDIIIGTHRLLSKDVRFKNLGLLIVDEEQRFGVRHKERLKQMRAEVDVLTLTATPIPRTLHMALAGIRDMSIIDTPPEDRVPIKTYVLPHEDSLIRDAIRREIDRGGQVYFVHNRVHSIYHIAAHLQHLVPEAAIAVAHGQLEERELEKTMVDFFNGEHDVLVCTTIIENGLDVPNANTLLIDDAPNYGLAQLYQLRGRVGRSANRAYAYLLYRQDKPMTQEAQQRLQAIQEATELGAGFRIAMRDLEIRGAGNLLGPEQSGHIAAVGFDLYSRLLEQAVAQLKQQADAAAPDEDEAAPPDARSVVVDERVLVSPLVTLDLPLTAYLPKDYIADESVRLDVYQRIAEIQAPDDVDDLRQELHDRFGEPPPAAAHLLIWLQIKALALAAGVGSVTTTSDEFIVRLPALGARRRETLRRNLAHESGVSVAQQSVRLDRRVLNGVWVEKLTSVLEVLARQGRQRQHTASRTPA
jgi:transcription-repair coupling factor (superfamily II helicase)